MKKKSTHCGKKAFDSNDASKIYSQELALPQIQRDDINANVYLSD